MSKKPKPVFTAIKGKDRVVFKDLTDQEVSLTVLSNDAEVGLLHLYCDNGVLLERGLAEALLPGSEPAEQEAAVTVRRGADQHLVLRAISWHVDVQFARHLFAHESFHAVLLYLWFTSSIRLECPDSK